MQKIRFCMVTIRNLWSPGQNLPDWGVDTCISSINVENRRRRQHPTLCDVGEYGININMRLGWYQQVWNSLLFRWQKIVHLWWNIFSLSSLGVAKFRTDQFQKRSWVFPVALHVPVLQCLPILTPDWGYRAKWDKKHCSRVESMVMTEQKKYALNPCDLIRADKRVSLVELIEGVFLWTLILEICFLSLLSWREPNAIICFFICIDMKWSNVALFCFRNIYKFKVTK